MLPPDVDAAGVTPLTPVTEVRHPGVVTETTDGDGAGAAAAPGTLVDFVVCV